MNKENMKVWDALMTTDPNFTKPFKIGGFTGTDINPMYRWMKLTELFGPAGSGWGVDSHTANIVDLPTGEKMICVSVTGFYMQDGTRYLTPPGFGQDYIVKIMYGDLKSDDESAKKAFTDALGNAFKYVGLCADVFLKMHDDSKYVNNLKEKLKGGKEPEQKQEPDLSDPFPDIPDDRGFLAVKKDGMVMFSLQQSDDGATDLANFAAWYISKLDKPVDMIRLCEANKIVLDGLKTDEGLNPIEQGACDYMVGKLSGVKKISSLNSAWSRISKEVNDTKQTCRPLYDGVTKAFKDKKAELKESTNE